LRREFGLIAPKVAEGVEARGKSAIDLMKLIDGIVAEHGFKSDEITALKPEADRLSTSSICQKREMNWPAASFMRNAPRILWAFATGNELRYGA
jgi:hypothetical protein